MSAVLALRPAAALAVVERTPWDLASDSAREEAMARGVLARRIAQKIGDGMSRRMAVNTILAEIRTGEMVQAIKALNGTPSDATLNRWVSAFQEGGLNALLPQYNGRPRGTYGWEARASFLFQSPSRPGFHTVADWLRDEGFDNATNSRVRRYLKSLPSNQAETSPKRLGRHTYDQTIKPHHRRDYSDLAVGEAMVSDGHCIKAVVYHPTTGDLFRPEVTPILDVKSNYCYGFWIAEAESSMDTVYALSSVMARYDQVPAWFISDPGPGFDNIRTASLFDRLGITHSKTLPGNARGKGFGEGFFHILTERFSKRFDTFCGDDRVDDALARMRTKVKRGELVPPTFDQFKDALEQYRVRYNAKPQPHSVKLLGKSPNDMMGQLKHNPLGIPVEDLLRPDFSATVRKWEVRFRNRFYRAKELAAYEGREVRGQYDENDESRVWVRDEKGRLICIAHLHAKTAFAKENVAADVRAKSLAAKVRRLQHHIDEATSRHRAPISTAGVIDALEHGFAPQTLQAPSPGLQLLAQGHSFTPSEPPQPVVREISARPVSREAQERLAHALEHEQPEETADQRFARAKALQAGQERGEGIGGDDKTWLSRYVTTSEYRSRERLLADFGGISGVPESRLTSGAVAAAIHVQQESEV